MAKIKNVTAYICAKYPHKSELSKARVTKLVYLADWKSAQRSEKQLTNINWYFHNYGPYVDDVVNKASEDSRFNIISTTTMYGDSKTLFSIKEGADFEQGLSASDMKIIDSVIDDTKNLYWDSFIKYVYDTFPIRETDRHKELDLVELAIIEKESNKASQ